MVNLYITYVRGVVSCAKKLLAARLTCHFLEFLAVGTDRCVINAGLNLMPVSF